MFGFIGRALAGVVLTKKARAAVKDARDRAALAGAKGKAASVATLQSHGKAFVTPERAELVQNAMKVHSAKQKILDSLSDEHRARLVGAAVKHLLHGDEQ